MGKGVRQHEQAGMACRPLQLRREAASILNKPISSEWCIGSCGRVVTAQMGPAVRRISGAYSN